MILTNTSIRYNLSLALRPVHSTTWAHTSSTGTPSTSFLPLQLKFSLLNTNTSITSPMFIPVPTSLTCSTIPHAPTSTTCTATLGLLAYIARQMPPSTSLRCSSPLHRSTTGRCRHGPAYELPKHAHLRSRPLQRSARSRVGRTVLAVKQDSGKVVSEASSSLASKLKYPSAAAVSASPRRRRRLNWVCMKGGNILSSSGFISTPPVGWWDWEGVVASRNSARRKARAERMVAFAVRFMRRARRSVMGETSVKRRICSRSSGMEKTASCGVRECSCMMSLYGMDEVEWRGGGLIFDTALYELSCSCDTARHCVSDPRRSS
ncbi:uncharacterized protein CC84DRAFT_1241846, partial [Paraphaeosphaeria sporulosa]